MKIILTAASGKIESVNIESHSNPKALNEIKLPIDGVSIIESFCASDDRGDFIKIFSDALSKSFDTNFRESYYSISKKNVIRGMHFQTPPFGHAKVVHVVMGAIVDVIVDLRKKSPTYLSCLSIELDAQNKKSVYIPEGCAHGFLSLVDNTLVQYHVTTSYNQNHDAGILWHSIPFQWNVQSPIISARDSSFIHLKDFDTPF